MFTIRLRGREAVAWAGNLLARLTLFQKFALFSLAILVVGALLIGRYMAGEIERGVIGRTGAITALYVDSFISPHLQGLREGGAIPAQDMERLDGLLQTTPLASEIVAFKVWSPEGEVLYARDRRLMGQRFPDNSRVQRAARGAVQARLSRLTEGEHALERQQWARLLEVYAPVYQDEERRVIAISEFYQLPNQLLGAIGRAQWRGWLIVGVATLAMYLLLVGLVRQASLTIAGQHRRLQGLAGQNAVLAERLRRAAAQKSETDERLLMRIAQDLHDGPAQDLSLALLRIDGLRRGAGAPDGGGRQQGHLAKSSTSWGAQQEQDFQLVQAALESALKEIRQVAAGLRLPELEELSLAQVVEKAAAEHQRKTGCQVELHLEHGLPSGSPAQKIALYRVIQEALNNAYQHAGVREQAVHLERRGPWLRLEIRDQGAGLDREAAARGASLGLRGMQERVELLGGTFTADSQPGRGTAIIADIPAETRAEV